MKGRRRLLGIFTIIISFVFTQTGCWDRIELNDVALVMALGVDKGTDGNLEISTQILNPRAAITTGTNEQITVVRTGTGKDMSQAFDRLQEKTSRRLFWGHSKIFVISETVAKENFLAHVDYLVRSPQPRNSAYFYICKGKAKDVLAILPPLERYSGEDLRELAALQIIPGFTQKDFRQKIVGKGGACYLPEVKVESTTLKEGKIQYYPKLNGFSVVKRGVFLGNLHGDTGEIKDVFSWLKNNRAAKSEVTIKPKGYKDYLTIRIYRSHVKIKPVIQDEQWIVKIDLTLKAALLQSNKANLLKIEKSKAIEKELNNEIKKRFGVVFNEIQNKYKADIFNFAEEFHRHYPDEFEKVGKNWDEKFATLQIQINPKVIIERLGLAKGPTYGEEREGNR